MRIRALDAPRLLLISVSALLLVTCQSVPRVAQTDAREAAGGSSLVSGNKVTLLRDGPQTIAAMKDAIRGARDHINVETFIFRDDEVVRPLADLLLRKQAEGVQVNLIYDSVGAAHTPGAFFDRLRAGGVGVLEFNPVNPFERLESGERTDGLTIDNRDHRKLMVVDGRIGFTGGINFHREYSNSSSAVIFDKDRKEPRYWRDAHVRIEGPAVAEMQKAFVDMWNRHSPLPLPPRQYFPELNAVGTDRVRISLGSPHLDVSPVYAAYIDAIRHAHRTVHLTHAYLVLTDELRHVLEAAAHRGVEVTLILPGFSDFWMPRYAGRYSYGDLLSSGVKIYERQGAMLHAKVGVVDGEWSTVGSSNLDFRSAVHDAKVNAIIVGPDFGLQMEEMFRFDLEHSQEILLKDWEHRPVDERFREWFAQLFKYWL